MKRNKIMMVSLCTTGVMREQFIAFANAFSNKNELYCITNDNVSNDDIHCVSMLNLRYKRSEPWSYFSFRKIVKIRKYINHINPDLIYIFTPHPVNILIPNIVKNYKLLYHSHDPIIHAGISKIDTIIRNIQNLIYNKISDVIVVAGDELKRQILSTSNIDPKKIISIPFPIFGNYINDDVTASENIIDLLFFGRIEAYKGIDVLLEAIDSLAYKPKVYIAGKGNILETFPNIKQVPANVKILGFVDDERLISYIKAAKATVFPYSDATGTSVVAQSFYYGTPVIATDVGVFPEYVRDGGIIVKKEDVSMLANAIDRLLKNEEYRKNLSKNAKRICEKEFMISVMEERYQVVFDSLVSH